MELLLKRIARKATYTIGHLYIDGHFFCDTLEDTDRGLSQDMSLSRITGVKVKGETAIPTGRYRLTVDKVSPKYSLKAKWMQYNKALMPRIEDVPGFVGILIHTGNKPKDTDGCVLVGENKIKGELIRSEETFKKLYPILVDAHKKGQQLYITVE